MEERSTNGPLGFAEWCRKNNRVNAATRAIGPRLMGLRIPATDELLADWYGPVDVRMYPNAPTLAAWDGEEEVVWERGWADTYAGEDGGRSLHQMPVPVSLDISRIEARNRVLCLLGRHFGAKEGSQPTWTFRGLWDLDFETPSSPRRVCFSGGSHSRAVYSVPALEELDPLDQEKLPDGSRRVDAEALRLCWTAFTGRAK